MNNELIGKRVSGLAITGFICSWILGPLGIVLSAVALSEIEHNEETLRGRVTFSL